MKYACNKEYIKSLSDEYSNLINTSINNIDYYIDTLSSTNNTLKTELDTSRDEALDILIDSRTKFETLL